MKPAVRLDRSPSRRMPHRVADGSLRAGAGARVRVPYYEYGTSVDAGRRAARALALARLLRYGAHAMKRST